RQFRPQHHGDSEPVEERDLLWPPLENDPYPFRVRISEPLYRANVRASEFTQSIGMFQKFHGHWGLAVQGFKGIFNPGLLDTDLELIKARMSHVSPSSLPPGPAPGQVR